MKFFSLPGILKDNCMHVCIYPPSFLYSAIIINHDNHEFYHSIGNDKDNDKDNEQIKLNNPYMVAP